MLVTKSKVWSEKGSRLPGGPNTKDVFGAGCTKSDALKKLMLKPVICAAHVLDHGSTPPGKLLGLRLAMHVA